MKRFKITLEMEITATEVEAGYICDAAYEGAWERAQRYGCTHAHVRTGVHELPDDGKVRFMVGNVEVTNSKEFEAKFEPKY